MKINRKTRKSNSIARRLVSIVTIFVMLFSIITVNSGMYAFAANKTATIVTPNGLNVREKAGTSYNVIITLPFETEVEIVGDATDSNGSKWYKVKKVISGDEIVGYVKADSNYIMVNDGSKKPDTSIVSKESNCSYADVLMEVGKRTGMSPYVIASMLIVEQGTSGVGNCISGKVSGYEGYYNYFNISAVAGSGYTAVENGLKYAAKEGTYERPWNSRFKSILGGAEIYVQNYIGNNQNTLYTKKWNVMNGLSNVSLHQYMTNIEGAYQEAKNLRNGYLSVMDESLDFIIPIYENMPNEVATPPSTNNTDEITALIQSAKESVANFVIDEAGNTIYADGSIFSPEGEVLRQPDKVEDLYIPINSYEVGLVTKGFPASYVPLLSALHELHPMWTFTPSFTGIDWEEAVKKEAVLGKSLVSSTRGAYYKSKKSPAYNSETGKYKSYDTGGWNAASTVAIKYFMDPRRFLTDTGIFIFMNQKYDPLVQTKLGLEKILAGTFMSGAFPEYVDAFGSTSGSSSGSSDVVNPIENNPKDEQTLKEKNASIISGVENTTIKNSSSLTSKGIKISWTKSAGYKVDYYEVFRSTKKSSGYGKEPFYTTSSGSKTTYTNTKDLKKGNTYYFKVRGVREIDGKKYYTAWSTKSYRTIK